MLTFELNGGAIEFSASAPQTFSPAAEVIFYVILICFPKNITFS
jgi:hypothetical protein